MKKSDEKRREKFFSRHLKIRELLMIRGGDERGETLPPVED
jgi:hypothetical protein